jgi:hypothetical protein
MYTLPCFTHEQYRSWSSVDRLIGKREQVSPCHDCTAEYQAQMIAAERCVHPEVTFYKDADGFISGHFPACET